MPGQQRQSLPSCEGCRRRKTKCDHRPECSGCVMRGENCIYRNGAPRLPQTPAAPVEASTSSPSGQIAASSPASNVIEYSSTTLEEDYNCLRAVADDLATQLGLTAADVDAMIHRTRAARQGLSQQDMEEDELQPNVTESDAKRSGSLPPIQKLPIFRPGGDSNPARHSLSQNAQPIRPLPAQRSYSMQSAPAFAFNSPSRFDFGLGNSGDSRPPYLPHNLANDLWPRQTSEGSASSASSFERSTFAMYSDSNVRDSAQAMA